MTAADESRVVWRHEDARNSSTTESHALAARSEPRAAGLRAPSAFTTILRQYAQRAQDNESGRVMVPAVVLDDAAAVIDDYRAALAATPPAEGLDVERIRTVIHWHICDQKASHDLTLGRCGAIALEVARGLAPEQPE